MGRWNPIKERQERAADREKRSERKVGFRFDPCGGRQIETGRPSPDEAEEGALARPGLPSNDERPARAAPSVVQHAFELPTLGVPPEQHPPMLRQGCLGA